MPKQRKNYCFFLASFLLYFLLRQKILKKLIDVESFGKSFKNEPKMITNSVQKAVKGIYRDTESYSN